MAWKHRKFYRTHPRIARKMGEKGLWRSVVSLVNELFTKQQMFYLNRDGLYRFTGGGLPEKITTTFDQ